MAAVPVAVLTLLPYLWRMMGPPMTSPTRAVRWYSSFYWRIGVSFVVFVIVVLIGQSLIVEYARTSGGFAMANPNGTANAIAARLGAAFHDNRNVDLARALADVHSEPRQPAYVVMADGRIASSSGQTLRADILRQAQDALSGAVPPAPTSSTPTGPVVTSPIQIDGRLVGLVVMPPPPPRSAAANIGEFLTLPGTLALIVATAIAALVIFAPARHRLRSLERAADQLGSGRLDTRAPVRGHDEIARLATAFNQMAADLQARTDALHVSDRLRRQMLADVSHELRTPLTTMRGYLDTLDMPEIALDEDRRRRYLETVRRETQRLERLVVDLLELARFENAAVVLNARVVAVERLFAGVLRRYEHDAAAAKVTLRSRVQSSADQIVADPDRLDQALSNLVANALRHTPPEGFVELEASTEANGIRLSVADSGRGIPEEHLPHVFDRFYKSDSARTTGPAGSGLGLSIVKAIVERHGGNITVTSRPGRTTFVMTLPHEASA